MFIGAKVCDAADDAVVFDEEVELFAGYVEDVEFEDGSGDVELDESTSSGRTTK